MLVLDRHDTLIDESHMAEIQANIWREDSALLRAILNEALGIDEE
jgi:hypothetical protein